MKKQWHFDVENLQYYQKQGKNKWFLPLLIVFIASLGFGFIFFIAIISFYETPKQRSLLNQLEIYENTLNRTKEKYHHYVTKLKLLQQYDSMVTKEIFEESIYDTILLASWTSFADSMQNVQSMISFTQNRLSKVENRLYIEYVAKLLAIYIQKHYDKIEKLPLRIPLPEGKYTLVSGYGKRIHPIFKMVRQHNGVDFAARAGTPVLATAGGIVVPPPQNMIGYGNVVCIDHENGFKTIYAQLLESKVKLYQKIKPNEVIGLVGSSGISYGPHLHYEIWYHDKPIDPMDVMMAIPPVHYFQMFTKAKQLNQSLS
ncbi:MAG: M23 family metallopeptidase [Bacteroidales bacterium]|nr:M23 family metallopeptidase [Bacteroidales bacterium]